VLKSTNDDVCSIIDPLYKKENNVTWRWPSEVKSCCRYILITF
jgi:hypothetical protein